MSEQKLEVAVFFGLVVLASLWVLFFVENPGPLCGAMMIPGFARIQGLLGGVEEEVKRLRENQEVVLWHITPGWPAAVSILKDGFAAPRHEVAMAKDQPWMPKSFLGQQGEDRVSCGVPGLWMTPWFLMKEMIGENGVMLEIRIPRETLMKEATVARTHVALGLIDGRRLELQGLTSIEVNVNRSCLNELVKEGRVRVREVPKATDVKEWLRLTLNGEQGLFGQACRRRRQAQAEARKYGPLAILGSILASSRPVLDEPELPPSLRRFIRMNLIYMEKWARGRELSPDESCNQAAWQELRRLLGQPVGWLEEAVAEGIKQGAWVVDKPKSEPTFNLHIQIPSLEVKVPSIEEMLEQGRKAQQWEDS